MQGARLCLLLVDHLSKQLPTTITFSAQSWICVWRIRSSYWNIAGIDKLQFQPNGDISGMVSAEGELVPLKTRIKPSTVGGAVEKWLIQVAMLAVL